MAVEKIVICLLLGILVTALKPTKAAKIYCPRKCHCSSDYIAVKCRGLDKFPVLEQATAVRSLDLSGSHITDIEKKELKTYENLQHLDIRYNEMKSVSPGLFSEMKSLRELYIDNNPWSCDDSTLHVLQMELTALAHQNSHLENFDGGKIECFDPPLMKGNKPLHIINRSNNVYNYEKDLTACFKEFIFVACQLLTKTTTHISDHLLTCDEAQFTSALMSSYLGMVYQAKQKEPDHWLTTLSANFNSNDNSLAPYPELNFPKFVNQQLIFSIQAMNKIYHLPQWLKGNKADQHQAITTGMLAVSIILVVLLLGAICGAAWVFRENLLHLIMKVWGSKLENDLESKMEAGELDNKSILIDSMKKRRRMSKGLPASAKSSASSVENAEGGVGDSTDKLESHGKLESNKILTDGKKRQHRSQGLAASAKRNTSSLKEVDEGVGDSTDKLESHGKSESSNALIESLKKRRHTTQGLPASAKSSTCSLEEVDGREVHSTDKSESHGQLESDSALTESLKKRRHTSQGLPASAKTSTCSLEEVGGREIDSTDKSESHGQLESDSALTESLKKRRHTSQGLPASAKSSTCSLEEVGGREVDSTDKSESHGQLESEGDMKRQHISWGLPASSGTSTSSLEDINKVVVDSVDKMENHSQLDSEDVLIDSVKKHQCMLQDFPAPETSRTSNAEDEVDPMDQSCESAEDSSDEEGYVTPP